MKIHEELREIVVAHGPGIFSDHIGFAGLLDDVLSATDATPGQANLLVDAVRYGAVPRLQRTTQTGAEPELAVTEVGQKVAELRGGHDLVAANWACAVLGYALGSVPEPVLARFPAPGPYVATTADRPQPPSAQAPVTSPAPGLAQRYPPAFVPSRGPAPTGTIGRGGPSPAAPDRFWLWGAIIIVMSGVLGALAVAIYLQT